MHLVQHRPERVNVRGRAEPDVGAFSLFGRHIVGRADHFARLRMGIGLLVQQSHPEVGDFGFAALVQQDVAGFDVAMNDAALMREIHGPGQTAGDRGRPNGRQRFAAERLKERLAFDIFEGQIGQPLVLADLKDLHDVGMLKPARRLGFAAEAR